MIRVTTAAQLLAELKARQAVKDELRGKGEKPQHYARSEINVLAAQWLQENRLRLAEQCLAEAKATLAKMNWI